MLKPASRRSSRGHALLARVLEQRELIAAVQSLPAAAVVALVRHVGLEDTGEIVALLSSEQLERVFDEDLWHSSAPGHDESFDAERFGLWLEVLLEAGDAVVAERLAALPEELLTFGLHQRMLVLSHADVLTAVEDEEGDRGRLLDKKLEGALVEEIDEFLLIARGQEHWDAIVAAVLALDRDHRRLLERVLECCRQLTLEHIDDNGGLFEVLSAAEMLAEDVGGERRERRAAEGHIAPSSAASFLALAREHADLDSPLARDTVTREYFRALEAARTRPPSPPLPTAAARGSAELSALLREAEVMPSAPLLRLAGGGSRQSDPRALVPALRRLADERGDLFEQRLDEITYLANVLVAGCSVRGRRFRPVEAFAAALDTCNLGLELRLEEDAEASADELLRREGAERWFAAAWRVLHREVAPIAAKAAIRRMRRSHAAEARSLQTALERGAPWTARRALSGLEGVVEAPVAAALVGLMGECPVLDGALAPPEADGAVVMLRHIATLEDLRRVRRFLAEQGGPRS